MDALVGGRARDTVERPGRGRFPSGLDHVAKALADLLRQRAHDVRFGFSRDFQSRQVGDPGEELSMLVAQDDGIVARVSHRPPQSLPKVLMQPQNGPTS